LRDWKKNCIIIHLYPLGAVGKGGYISFIGVMDMSSSLRTKYLRQVEDLVWFGMLAFYKDYLPRGHSHACKSVWWERRLLCATVFQGRWQILDVHPQRDRFDRLCYFIYLGSISICYMYFCLRYKFGSREFDLNVDK
jgi:hypothetical protein